MKKPFCSQNVPVHFNGFPAIMNPIPHEKIVISYTNTSHDWEPTIISLEAAERALGKELQIRTGKPKSRNAKRARDLTAVEKQEYLIRELYLDALRNAKSTAGCGGTALRIKVIQQVHEEFKVKLISASTLAAWHKNVWFPSRLQLILRGMVCANVFGV